MRDSSSRRFFAFALAALAAGGVSAAVVRPLPAGAPSGAVPAAVVPPQALLPPRSGGRSAARERYDRVLPFWMAHVVDTFDSAACGLSDAAGLAEVRRLRVRTAQDLARGLTHWDAMPWSVHDDSLAAAALVARGCSDPVVVRLAALCGGRFRLMETPSFIAARDAQKDPVLRMVLWCGEFSVDSTAANPAPLVAVLRSALPAILAGPADLPYDLYGMLPVSVRRPFAALPGIPAALADLAHGDEAANRVWKRASASPVCICSNATWAIHRQAQQTALPFLLRAAAAAPAEPLVLRKLLEASTEVPAAGDPAELFARLVAADENAPGALHLFAWHHLSGVWGGSSAACEAFLLRTISSGRTDTLLPYRAALALICDVPHDYEDFPAWRRHFVAQRQFEPVYRMVDACLAEKDRTMIGPEDPYCRLAALAALLAHDLDTARRYLSRLADRSDAPVRWTLFEYYPGTFPARIRERLHRAIRLLALESGSVERPSPLSRILALERQANSGGISAALAGYLALDRSFATDGVKPSPATETLIDWVEMRIADLRAEYAAAHPGEWVPLPPTARLHEYAAPKGTRYGVGSNSFTTCRNYIYGLAEFPPDDIEFRWTVHYAAEYSAAPAPEDSGASWAPGYRFNQMKLVGHVTVWWWPGRPGGVSLGTGRVLGTRHGRTSFCSFDLDELPPYHVRVRLQDATVTVYVNGRKRLARPRGDLLAPPPPPGPFGDTSNLFRDDHDAALTPTFFTEQGVSIGDSAVRVIPAGEQNAPEDVKVSSGPVK